ncbi:carbohydrate ABC transporter substrate-binding protein [Candidatus Dojkabacteria bacterium]|nr:carbohydrate ABC transporter substrate-binding protein [Candidatus Dojkabacteria bacterium]
MKKILVLLLVSALVLATASFAAVAEEAVVTEDVSLTFVFAGGDPLAKELLIERIDAFNDTSTHVTIVAQPSSSGGYLDFIKTKDAVGEFPDMLECRDVQVWVEKLAELPTVLVEMLDNPQAYEGKYYTASLSQQLTSLGCYYNKDMFDALNLEEPQTYDEFLALCETIKDSGVAPIVIGGKDIWHIGFWWGNYWIKNVFAENPNWIADKYEGKTSFTDANVQKGFKQFADLFEKDYVEKGWLSTADNQIVSFLISEKAAMFFSGSWMVGQVSDADPAFNLGWFPVPDVDGELRLYGGADLAGFALSKDAAEDPNKVAAFVEFVKFFYADEQYAPYLSSISMGPATLNPPTINYASDLIQEFAEAREKAVFIDLNWNNKWGDNLLPGAFRNYAYKAFQDMIGEGKNTKELGESLDKQWDAEVELLSD